MSRFDDYVNEMSTDEFERFSEGVRAAATRMPNPSPDLARMLTHGISSEPEKRSIVMRAKAYVAGLGVAAKVLLGAGVAAATATAAGVGPIDFSPAKEQSVTAGVDKKERETPPAVKDTTTTTVALAPVAQPEPTTTTTSKPVVLPKPDKPATTTTQKPYVEPQPDKPTTSTTAKPKPPEPLHDISLACEPDAERVKVFCSWSATASADHMYYKLVRSNADGSDWQKLYKSEDGREYWDTTPIAGNSYKYFVYSLRADGSIASESNTVLINCC